MKKSLLFLIPLLLSIMVSAQSFAPIGATWHYTTQGNVQDSLRWIKVETLADSLFAGKNAKIFTYTYESSNALACPNYVDTSMMAQQNDSLFFYENGNWQLLVDFNASVSDTFKYDIAYSNGSQTLVWTIEATVDSIAQRSYNNQPLRSLYLSQVNNTGSVDFHDGWITETIGHEYAPLPWVNSSCAFAGMYIYGLRCYSDSNIGNIQFTSYACESVTTSLAQQAGVEAKLEIYPNPTKGELKIETNKLIQSIELFNYQGQKLKELNPLNRQIKLPDESGVYLVRITTNSGQLIDRKVIKH